jgi:hypothetical protein
MQKEKVAEAKGRQSEFACDPSQYLIDLA